MELPEEDKQALMDAFRKRSQQKQGGAAFGVYPSSGKRPEKLNVSRDVNMPAQMARGWAAGTLGLPGDIESLGRLLRNIGPEGLSHMRNVSETPVLPTSDFYQEWLPGRDERPAAKAVSGLGALTGGLGATKVAGAAVKGAKATGKALGPKAAEMAESYLQKSGLAPSVVKPKGGNWLSGSVETATKPLRNARVEDEVYLQAMRNPEVRGPYNDWLNQKLAESPEYRNVPGIQAYNQFAKESNLPAIRAEGPEAAVNEWIDKKLNRYIKNEMGTPEDPVRKLAERDVLHIDPEQLNFRPEMHGRYLAEGQTAVAQSPTAKTWEGAADLMIAPARAGELLSKDTWLADLPQYRNPLENNPWLEKVSPDTSVYALSTEAGSPTVGRDLGFDHLIDELRNATRADSDLPANLRWKPEDLQKVTMEQAVERVAKINEYRAAKKAEANEVLARNPATAPYREYQTVPGTQEPNSKGLSWKQIKAPEGEAALDDVSKKLLEYNKSRGVESSSESISEAQKKGARKMLEDALKYEGDVMGHCVGGYCDDVLTGRSQIYSLRDKKGEPHVTIEVQPVKNTKYETEWFTSQPESVQDEITAEAIAAHEAAKKSSSPAEDRHYYGMALSDAIRRRIGESPPEIIQIKGKGNAAPKAEYLPFVQDFVRSGQWSRVGDIQNTGMRDITRTPNLQKWLKSKNIPHNKYVTEQEYAKYETDFLADRLNQEGAPGFAKGGLVQDTDAIVAQLKGMDKDKALTQALRMANAKQEANMAAGGLAKLLKGAKKAEDVAKPAQIGNYQALPLKLPRAPNLPQQELTKTAERVARQQMGEHVRKSATEAQNLAGRSMKEAERLKQLNIKLQPTKEIPTPAVVPEEIGQVRIALPGDISVADKTLMSIDDMPIGAPQEGGPMYGAGKQDLEDPRFWASNEGPAQIFQSKVTDLANLYETPEVLAQHLAMGHDAMNFAQHFADANLLAIQASKVKAKDAKEFDRIIKEGFEKINPKTKERVRITFPDFPGIRNYEEAYKATQENPELRKWFNNRMKVEKITGPLGLPSGKEVEYAIMEPALSNIEHSMTGLSVGRMKPGASLIPGSEHKTYSHDIAGQALGRTRELTPIELAFPDASAYIRGTKRPQDFTPTIQKLFPHQVVDDQYINQLGEYYNRLKQIRGYKKGGAVKKSGLSVLNKAII